jgi:CBS domain containing-hemolysin-like protein
VFRDTLDEVTGILYAKDLLAAIIADEEPEAGWQTLQRPPAFIPVSKRIDEQLREFQATRTHIAIVSDEYGGTAGLVTIEDILEEIVGEIRDEYDVEAEPIVDEGNGHYLFSGKVAIEDMAERVGVEIEPEGYETVGGFLLAHLGRVPAPGEALDVAGLHVEVLEAERRRVHRVRITKVERRAHAETPAEASS